MRPITWTKVGWRDLIDREESVLNMAREAIREWMSWDRIPGRARSVFAATRPARSASPINSKIMRGCLRAMCPSQRDRATSRPWVILV